ncbi:hypothetical protein E4U43_001751 [Claviceps pusilla]|uniref:Protein kinase domain-containing protein n=1 Tax=Claviceps pusilla TaxID=123648 RepID=A0A9P7N769_9HYPO|nr:hypothetical protein E4U43_001751 [Claviceps pusilla]
MLQRLDHPSIVKFFGADARFFSIYMEYVAHPDLSELRSQPDDMFTGTTDDAIRVLGDMASALDYLATQNILHNDIKPANILYDGARGAILIDFELASFMNEEPCTGGTAWYVPPESRCSRLELEQQGSERDIFALGVTLLYLLKKTPLPERVGYRFDLWKVGEDTNEASQMNAWLEEVSLMSLQLQDGGIELLVKQMVEEAPGNRISAELLLKSHKELFG